MKQILFVQYGDFAVDLLKDIIDLEETGVIYVNQPIKNPLKRIIRKLHLSHKVEDKIKLPFQTIWLDKKSLQKYVEEDTKFIFTNCALAYMRMEFLEYIQKKYSKQPKVVLIFDSLHAHSYNIKYSFPLIQNFKWDLVLSYDKQDCQEFGFQYLGYSYYSKVKDFDKDDIKYDLLYVGFKKTEGDQRIKMITDIFNRACNKGIKCKFIIVKEKQNNVPKGINAQKDLLTYDEILSYINQSKCILEVLQTGQQQQSVRPFEAYCYNKKLLTNYPGIYELPFYDEKQYQYFNNISDIDFNWIKEEMLILNTYNKEFSPIHILSLIDRLIGDKSEKL